MKRLWRNTWPYHEVCWTNLKVKIKFKTFFRLFRFTADNKHETEFAFFLTEWTEKWTEVKTIKITSSPDPSLSIELSISLQNKGRNFFSKDLLYSFCSSQCQKCLQQMWKNTRTTTISTTTAAAAATATTVIPTCQSCKKELNHGQQGVNFTQVTFCIECSKKLGNFQLIFAKRSSFLEHSTCWLNLAQRLARPQKASAIECHSGNVAWTTTTPPSTPTPTSRTSSRTFHPWRRTRRCPNSPIFYEQLFCTKVFCTVFMCLQFGFVIFCQKNIFFIQKCFAQLFCRNFLRNSHLQNHGNKINSVKVSQFLRK